MELSSFYENQFKTWGMLILPPVLKTIMFYFIFRITKCNTTLLLCLLLAFIPAAILFIVPIHITVIWSFISVIIFGLLYLKYFSEVALFPAGFIILVIVEGIVRGLQEFVF